MPHFSACLLVSRCASRGLLALQGRSIEVANLAENNREDVLHDLSRIVYHVCARLYGQRRAKRKKELIGKILTEPEEGEHA
jgi:putative resolvase